MAKAKEIQLTPQQDNFLKSYLDTKRLAKEGADLEFAARQEIVRTFGFDPTKLEGSESLSIGYGYKLKATKVQNYALTNENGETINLLTVLGNELQRTDLANTLVKWKPELSTTIYKEIMKLLNTPDASIPAEVLNHLRDALAKALTIKPGAPQLELVPPAEKAKEEIEIESATAAPPQ